MKIAIMGAGLSGLSCAITLEKNGVTPYIFERRSRVGDRFVNGEALFNIFNKPINNCLDFLDEEYGIHLEPCNNIKKAYIHSKNQVGSIEGNLGVTNVRGRQEYSFEAQLSRKVKSDIIFNSKYAYEDLKKEFTHVVLAPGDGAYAAKLDNYKSDLTSTIRGATIEGEFNSEVISAWINHDFIPKGYAYQLPFSEKEANIALAYPDYPENINMDIDSMWEEFFNQVCKDLGQDLRITDKFEITRYMIGRCEKPKIENTYFVGNCFGAILPFLGFGQFVAILTGIYAALDICGIGKYEELTKPLFKQYENSYTLRKIFEKLEDNMIDFIVKNLDNALFDNTINKICSDDTEANVLRWIGTLAKPLT